MLSWQFMSLSSCLVACPPSVLQGGPCAYLAGPSVLTLILHVHVVWLAIQCPMTEHCGLTALVNS